MDSSRSCRRPPSVRDSEGKTVKLLPRSQFFVHFKGHDVATVIGLGEPRHPAVVTQPAEEARQITDEREVSLSGIPKPTKRKKTADWKVGGVDFGEGTFFRTANDPLTETDGQSCYSPYAPSFPR